MNATHRIDHALARLMVEGTQAVRIYLSEQLLIDLLDEVDRNCMRQTREIQQRYRGIPFTTTTLGQPPRVIDDQGRSWPIEERA